MTTYERIEELRRSKHISQGKLEKELGFSNGSISKWRTSMPKPERLQKIADYFGVTIDYLMNGEEKEWSPTLTEKDEKDLDKKVESLLNAVTSDTGLMLDGEIMDDETREIFAMNLKNALRTTKLAAKAKYTPNKYRK